MPREEATIDFIEIENDNKYHNSVKRQFKETLLFKHLFPF